MTGREPWCDALQAAQRDAEADSGVYEVDEILDRATDAELEAIYTAAGVLHRRSRRLWALRRADLPRGWTAPAGESHSQSVPRP